MMNTEELKNLLKKYYDGNTSEAEEIILRRFFNENDIPAGFEVDKEIFGFYSSLEKIPEPSSDFEERILTGIDKNIPTAGSSKEKRLVISLLSAAAGVLLLIGSYFFFVHKAEPRDTFSNLELAYAETMKILYDVSSKLNQGTQGLKPLGKMHEVSSKSFEILNKPTMIIEENMNNLKYIREGIDIFSKPLNDIINN